MKKLQERLILRLEEELNNWLDTLPNTTEEEKEKEETTTTPTTTPPPTTTPTTTATATTRTLRSYAYEYCFKMGIVEHFSENTVSEDLAKMLLAKQDILDFLYMEYLEDDTAKIHREIDKFISNLGFKNRLKKIYAF